MLIRIGYDIELGVTAPMTLVYLLRVHPSRAADLVAPEALSISPALPVQEYVDAFGNRCARLRVPQGVESVRLRNRALVRDSGLPDPVVPDARQLDPGELPVETLPFLLPSRYCEVDSELPRQPDDAVLARGVRAGARHGDEPKHRRKVDD